MDEVDGARVSATNIRSLNRLTMTNGAVLTHPATGPDGEQRLELSVTNLVFGSNASKGRKLS